MLKKISKLAVGVVLAIGSTSGFARDDGEMRKYVSLDYNHIVRDNDRNSLDANGVSLGFGLPLTRKWGLEASAFYDSFNNDSTHPAKWGEYGVKLDNLFFPFRSRAFTPYLGLGLGAIRSSESTSSQKSTDPFADAGAGFFKYFSIASLDFAVRADARYRWVNTKITGVHALSEPVLKVGLVLPFGAGAKADAPVVAAPAVSPPPAPPEAAPEAPVATPPPAPVVEAPAKLDTDGDGVLDDQDTCANTPVGTKVGVNGCPIEDIVRQFEAVHFGFDKSALTEESKATLDGAVSAIMDLAKKASVKVEVGGHADNVGTAGYNEALSERRAKAVTDYLTNKGVDGNSITTNAYGETMPAESNETAEGRASNRRAEVKAKARPE